MKGDAFCRHPLSCSLHACNTSNIHRCCFPHLAAASSLAAAPPDSAASFCSKAMSFDTPSIIFCTSCTSLKPMRCLFEMSHLAPTAALCSPEDPRGCRSKPEQISSSLCGSLLSSGAPHHHITSPGRHDTTMSSCKTLHTAADKGRQVEAEEGKEEDLAALSSPMLAGQSRGSKGRCQGSLRHRVRACAAGGEREAVSVSVSVWHTISIAPRHIPGSECA